MKNKILSLFKHKKLVGFFVVLAVGGVALRQPIKEKVLPQPEYKMATVQKKTLTKGVSASGKIESDEKASLKFQTSGYLVWVGVKKGDHVKKWQAIASLDKEELQKKLKQELIDYMNERWDFQEDRETYHVTTDKLDKYTLEYDIRNLLDKAQFDLDRTVLDVEIQNLALKYATLVSPIEGIVTEIETPHAGVNITPATAEFVISNPEKMVFVAKVDEFDIGQTKEGQPAVITLDAYPDEPIESKVTEIDFTSTTTSSGGTAFEVKLPLPENSEKRFKIGMNGDVEITLSKEEGTLVVPFEAVREKDGKQYLWMMKEEPVKNEVKIGFTSGTDTQIISGAGEGEKVITSNFQQLEKNNK